MNLVKPFPNDSQGPFVTIRRNQSIGKTTGGWQRLWPVFVCLGVVIFLVKEDRVSGLECLDQVAREILDGWNRKTRHLGLIINPAQAHGGIAPWQC
jgi:hypothetical protein